MTSLHGPSGPGGGAAGGGGSRAKEVSPGLCGECAHAHVVVSGRGSKFWRCLVHDSEPAWPKYPPLPVLRCARFTAKDGGVSPGSGEG